MSEDPKHQADKPFVRRKHCRYPPEPLEIAYIDPESGSDREFSPKYVGLIIEEAAIGGCCLAILNPEELHVGKHCRIQLGQLPVVRSEMRWEKGQELGITIAGFKFLE